MNIFNYFFTPVGPEYKKKLARNVGIAVLILFAFYGVMNLFLDTTFVVEPESKITDSLTIPNAERDAKLAAGCELYPGGGWTCPEFSETTNFENITLMEPNSARHFYYPNPEQTENRDVFQMFSLIRLPEHLGGDADDISAFRAYSGVTLTTDHCVVKYWPDPGRHRLEDPCWGSMYRVIDGLMITNPDLIMNTSPVALPYLELSMDEYGSLYVEPPTFTREENGAIGTGRFISSHEIDHGSQIMIDGYEKSHPNHPKVPLRFAGNYLTELHAYGNDVEVRYADLKSLSSPYIDLWIDNVSAVDQQHFMNFKSPNSEFWQLGDVVFKISGHALNPNNAQSKYPQEYKIEFILDGFMFLVVGTNDELLKKAIVLNYFPEHAYDDMFLISTTVGK